MSTSLDTSSAAPSTGDRFRALLETHRGRLRPPARGGARRVRPVRAGPGRPAAQRGPQGARSSRSTPPSPGSTPAPTAPAPSAGRRSPRSGSSCARSAPPASPAAPRADDGGRAAPHASPAPGRRRGRRHGRARDGLVPPGRRRAGHRVRAGPRRGRGLVGQRRLAEPRLRRAAPRARGAAVRPARRDQPAVAGLPAAARRPEPAAVPRVASSGTARRGSGGAGWPPSSRSTSARWRRSTCWPRRGDRADASRRAAPGLLPAPNGRPAGCSQELRGHPGRRAADVVRSSSSPATQARALAPERSPPRSGPRSGCAGSGTCDPPAYVRSLAEAVIARGGTCGRARRRGSGRASTRWSCDTAVGEERHDAVVVATGAWLGGLARRFGVRQVVQAGRGYSFSVPVEAMPAGPLYFPAQRVACTPLGDRLRVAGMMEFRRPGGAAGPAADRGDHRRRPAVPRRRRPRRPAGRVGRLAAVHRRRAAAAGPHRLAAGVRRPAGTACGASRSGRSPALLVAQTVLKGETPPELRPFDPLR